MSIPKNTQDFDLCVAVVLSQLYEAFPIPKEINTFEIESVNSTSRTLKSYGDKQGQTEEVQKEIENTICNYRWTLSFLKNEGIVRDIKEEQSAVVVKYTNNTLPPPSLAPNIRSLVLTSKGLALLNATPKSLSGNTSSYAERFREGLKNSSKEVIRESSVSFLASIAALPLM